MKTIPKGLTEDIIKEMCRKAYFYNSKTANGYHFVKLEYRYSDNGDKGLMNVKALVYEIEMNLTSDMSLDELPENGEEFYTMELSNELLFELDIWGKYFFPIIHENQWYHKEDWRDEDYIGTFNELMKFAYDTAMKVSKLHTY